MYACVFGRLRGQQGVCYVVQHTVAAVGVRGLGGRLACRGATSAGPERGGGRESVGTAPPGELRSATTAALGDTCRVSGGTRLQGLEKHARVESVYQV